MTACPHFDPFRRGSRFVNPKRISLPPYRQCAFENLKTVPKRKAALIMQSDKVSSSPLHLFCVGTGKSRHKRKQLLSLQITGVIIEAHREPADWP